jgi:serine/threonine protein kinase
VQVCDALTHADARDVIHLDVSLANVLIADAHGTAKLADFGLASDARESPAGRVHEVMGTPGYVAPEIVRGAKPSPRSDLYSLGAVTYRLLLRPEVPPADPGSTAALTTAVARRAPLSQGTLGAWSSASTPSPTTYARCSPSSTSPRATSSVRSCPTTSPPALELRALVAQVDHDHGVAPARELPRDLAAGPARATGDDRHRVG